MNNSQQQNDDPEYSFARKVWVTGAILSFIVVCLLLLAYTFNALLLVFAGALIAVFFRGLGSLIARITGWRTSWSMVLAVVGTLLIIGGLFFLVGSKVQAQMQDLRESLPAAVEKVKSQLSEDPIGKRIVEEASSPEASQKAEGVARTFFKSTFGVLGDLYVVLFIGIFFTAAPGEYTSGLVQLVPPKRRTKAKQLIEKIGETLKKWLKGKLFAMVVVFALTATGLLIVGIPMWLTLALIAGILNFIPNFGPLIAMIPAVLIAFMQGPVTAAIVGGMYALIQVVESNFITPFVQKRLVQVPPALILIAQLLIAPLTNAWGLVLATPLLIIIMVTVKELYIKQMKQEANQ